jgi:hypothetical protein
MMKKLQLTIVMGLMAISSAYALFDTPGTVPQNLPWSPDTYYYGAHEKTFGDMNMTVRLEFAVYNDTQADDVIEWTGYAGDADYVYAYQIFCQDAEASLEYFELTGLDPDTIASVEMDIHEQESLNSTPSGGIQPMDEGHFNDAKTKAIWEFDQGTLVQGEQSWFLFLYSDSGPVVGDFNVQPLADDDIPVPGGDVPEPATLALLMCGSLLSLKRKK